MVLVVSQAQMVEALQAQIMVSSIIGDASFKSFSAPRWLDKWRRPQDIDQRSIATPGVCHGGRRGKG